MSSLLIEAVVLLCKTCEWSLLVEIENKGYIQIGDDNIYLLMSLYQNDGDTSEEMSVPEEFFKSYQTMPVACTCQECYQWQIDSTGQANIDSTVQTIRDCFNQIFAYHSNYKGRYNHAENITLESWLQDIDFEWLRRTNEKAFIRTLGHAQYDKPDQRSRLIKQYVAEGKSSIMQSAIAYFSNQEEMQLLQDEYRQVVEPWFQQINLLTDSIRKYQRDPIVKAYEHLDKTTPINLNNHIYYEGTLAYPLQDCAEYHVYQPIQYNLNRVDQLLQDYSSIGNPIPKEKAIINAVRKKIQQIAIS